MNVERRRALSILALLCGVCASVALACALRGAVVPVRADAAPVTGSGMLQGGSAITRYVAITGTDAFTCATPVSACRTIQYAVDVANEGDLIKVATGVYSDVHTRGFRGQIVYLTKTLTVQGGFTTTNWGVSNPVSYPTTLDAHGDGGGIYVAGEWGAPDPISPTIEGLHITGGYANGTGIGGAGILVEFASAIIRHNWIVGNDASSGGGMSLLYSDARVISNTIVSNTATAGGGGLMLFFSEGYLGGNTISFNTASHGGGLAIAWGSAPFVDRNVIFSNTANYGGGLFTNLGEPVLSGNLVASNVAQRGGGAWLDTSEATLENAMIVDNHATVAGSGLLISSSSIHLVHATIARNGQGGPGGEGTGICVSDFTGYASTVALTNTILVSHAVGISVAQGSVARLEGTLWGSGTWANGSDWAGAGRILTGSVNLWEEPGFRDPENGDYHLLPGSPAVDGGVFSGVQADVDGDARPADGGYDIGADERPGASLVLSHSAQPPDVSPGEMLTYGLSITNAGVQTTTNVQVVERLPALQWAVDVTTNWGECVAGGGWGGSVGCDLGGMEPGDSARITVTAEVTTARPPMEQLPWRMRATGWVTANETANHALVDTYLQDCHIRLNDELVEYDVVQEAIDASTRPTDVIRIAGACTVVSTRRFPLHDTTQIGYITGALTLQGGWNVSFTHRNVVSYPTTLHAWGRGAVLRIDGSVGTRVEGLRITGGREGVRTASLASSTAGGVSVDHATVTIADCLVRGNRASIGGGLRLLGGNATLINNVIADNDALLSGGGLYAERVNSRLLHTTLARNSAGDGSGVFLSRGLAVLTNSIVASHSVGVLVEPSEGSAIFIGTLWAGNATNWAGEGTIEHSGDYTGTPAFLDPDGGDYHIGPGSAAIDAGVDAGVTSDIDGELRPATGPDLGADEYPWSLRVVKAADPDVVRSGGHMSYTIWVSNTGSVTLTAAITDHLPAHVVPTGLRTWTTVITAPGGVWEQTVPVTVEAGYAGTLTNVVEVRTDEGATGIYTETNVVEVWPVEVRFSSAEYEVSEGAGEAVITATLSGLSELTVTVVFSTADGTATAGEDYVAVSGTLIFTPGILSRVFSVAVISDTRPEMDETVLLGLGTPENAVVGTPAAATLVILGRDWHVFLPLVSRSTLEKRSGEFGQVIPLE